MVSGREKTMDRVKVMKVTNWLIQQLFSSDDVEFVDRVLDAVASADGFTEEEIRVETLSGCYDMY